MIGVLLGQQAVGTAATKEHSWAHLLHIAGVVRQPLRKQNVRLANPSNYLALIRRLRPGDTLILTAGIYDDPDAPPGLPIFDLHGTPGSPIIITGPDTGPRPVLRARATHNTVRIADASYIIVRNLELDGQNLDVDGVKAQGISHHITLEDLLIKNHGANQQTVGISTKAPAWHWVIRRNVIVAAGTGMYLGQSDGSAAFIGGLIEHNLIVDTKGYNIEIKHQKPRPTIPGAPLATQVTIIRHNVLSKMHDASMGDMARPNLLLGHFPLRGPGANDNYQIYGNFIYQNPTGECLFQGEGNIVLHHNLFVNNAGDAVCIQPHKDTPRMIYVFNNTVVARGTGIMVRGGHPAYEQKVFANAVFATYPIRARQQIDNVTGWYESAHKYLAYPYGKPGELNLMPRPGALSGDGIDLRLLQGFIDADLDFDGFAHNGKTKGAYAAGRVQPVWIPRLVIKPAAHISDKDSQTRAGQR